MPEVGFDRTPVHYDLKTVEGGFVKLRRLPYDEILKRREMGTRLSMEQTAGRGRRGARSKQEKQEAQKIGIELAQVITREYEFANCIVEHNLTVDGQLIDFSQPKLAFRLVSPQVLQEIELYLGDLNMETDEDELEDFLNAVKPSSSVEGNSQPPSTERDLLESVPSGSE